MKIIIVVTDVVNDVTYSRKSVLNDSSSLTNEKDHHYFLNSADVCW